MGNRSFMVLLTVFCMMFVAGTGWCADFSADVSMEGPMGRMESKIYSRDGVLRQESAGPMGRTATIIWPEKDRSVILLLDQNAYMEIEDPEEGMGMEFPEMSGGISEVEEEPGTTRVGIEKIQGFTCEKLEVIDSEMPGAKSTIWFSRELGFPLKTVYESPGGNMVMECSNISLKKPDASLFRVPTGFQKLDIPMGMPSEFMEMPDPD